MPYVGTQYLEEQHMQDPDQDDKEGNVSEVKNLSENKAMPWGVACFVGVVLVASPAWWEEEFLEPFLRLGFIAVLFGAPFVYFYKQSQVANHTPSEDSLNTEMPTGFAVLASLLGLTALSYDPQTFSIAAASCLTIVGYWFYSAFTPSYQSDIGREQISDNTYFLGFILTLTAMTSGLIQYDPVSLGSESGRGNLDVIIQNFGIALTTTIAGMVIRSILLQGFRDGEEIQRSAALEAADQLKEATDAAIENINAVSQRVGQINRSMERGVPLSLRRMQRVRSSLKTFSDSSNSAANRITVSSIRVADALEKEIAGRAKEALVRIRLELDKLEETSIATSTALYEQTSATIDLGKAANLTTTEIGALTKALNRAQEAADALAKALSALAAALKDIDEGKIATLARMLQMLNELLRQLSASSPEKILEWSEAVNGFLENVERLGTEFLTPLGELIETFPELGVRADCAATRLDKLSDVLKKVNTPPQHIMDSLEVLGNHSEKIKKDITKINVVASGFIAHLYNLRKQTEYATNSTSLLSTEVEVLGNRSEATAPKVKSTTNELQDLSTASHDQLAPELEDLIVRFEESSTTAAELKDALKKVDVASKELVKDIDEIEQKLKELAKKEKGIRGRVKGWFSR